MPCIIHKKIMVESIQQRLPIPTGLLVSPKRDFVLFFIQDPKYQMSSPKVITQLWHCTVNGIPARLKNIRKMNLESALETWSELISNGWELVNHQLNEDVA